jgi:hypothetical protein
MSLLHPVHKSRQMNSSENFYIQLLQWHNTIINEQSEKHENPLFDLLYDMQIKHACAWPTSILFRLIVDFSTVQPAETTSSNLVRNILITILAYSPQYTILFINILITSYTRISCISGWHYDAHNTGTLMTHVNQHNFICILYLNIFWTIYLKLNILHLYIGCESFVNISFAQQPPEDGQKRWPNHVKIGGFRRE